MRPFAFLVLAVAGLAAAGFVQPAAASELNIYSARHYSSDDALYDGFTRATGIKLNRVEASGDQLLARLRQEGRNSPADVLVVVDAGNLWLAERDRLFRSVRSATLEKAIPARFRHPDGLWFGFATRARVVVYNKDTVAAADAPRRYEDLANPRWKGKLCMRSSSSVYNLSLMASLIHRLGEEKAEAWARGLVANFARDPKGGDTDQIRAVATGECALTLANTYYVVRLMKSDKDADRAVAAKIGIVFPNQDAPNQNDRGTHINVSGAGVLAHAPNPENAVRFLEYLLRPEAQALFAAANNEYPVAIGVAVDPALKRLGDFKADDLAVHVLGENRARAQKAYDRAGFK
ncbi:MAG: Fe(3+) ABC transporter substrate-binding protein [Rhodospirillales bacterium]|nr:Fe(3+) ABC transporter substrate-binding protein [Rhodospirillales bacterium]MSP80405.1 Fe(3+) ABC transporter substrate-binding protein [Rhodospirillales bacterium]